MKITTLNLFGVDNWQERQPRIIEYIKKTDPDIVFFQEVVYITEVSQYNQVQLLNQDLGYMSEHSSVTRLQVGRIYPVYREGLAFISKLPITKTDTLVLKKAALDEHNRIVQFIDVVIDNELVKFAHVHFSITDVIDFATAHLQEVLEILEARGERRIIIGDFNLDNLDSTKSLWEENYHASTEFDYMSFPSMSKSIDYVLIPKTYEFNIIILSDDTLSDHRAVTADISRV